MTIRNELIDELLAGRDPASVLRHDGLLGELKQALLNRLMAVEFDHHMEQERASGEGRNHRNGATRKRVLTGDGRFYLSTAPYLSFAGDYLGNVAPEHIEQRGEPVSRYQTRFALPEPFNSYRIEAGG